MIPFEMPGMWCGQHINGRFLLHVYADLQRYLVMVKRRPALATLGHDRCIRVHARLKAVLLARYP